MSAAADKRAGELSLPPDAVDAVGLEGAAPVFNAGIAAALLAAASGARIIARGGFGAARGRGLDVLSELGVAATAEPERVAEQLAQTGLAFFDDSPAELTPLERARANPLGLTRRLALLPNADLAQLAETAEALQAAGATTALAASAESGGALFDIEGHTALYQIVGGKLKRRRARAADFGLPENDRRQLQIADPRAAAQALLSLLDGAGGEQNAPASPERAVFCAALMNAAPILLIAGTAVSFQHGAELARDAVVSGAAKRLLEKLRTA